MSNVKNFNISLSMKEIVLVSALLESYYNYFSDSVFIDIDCSPGLRDLAEIREKFDNSLNSF